MMESPPEFVPIPQPPRLEGVHILPFDIEDWFHLCGWARRQ